MRKWVVVLSFINAFMVVPFFFPLLIDSVTVGPESAGRKPQRENCLLPALKVKSFVRKSSLACQANSPQARTADSSSINGVSFHPRAQRNAFHRRDVRQQRRLFARENPRLKRNSNSNRLC
jgi:hypothetical protein